MSLPPAVRLELSCPWCHDAVVAVFRLDPEVESLRADPSRRWLEVTHQRDPAAVLRTIEALTPLVEVAPDGEATMRPDIVPVDNRCARHPAPNLSRAFVVDKSSVGGG